ncbi:MAG: hypothetical protein ACPG77_02785 [Nannocystaceae bacterium]
MLPCPSCSRHIEVAEGLCPFCGARTAVPTAAPRVMAVVATAIVGLSLTSCTDQPTTSSSTMATAGTTQGSGGPNTVGTTVATSDGGTQTVGETMATTNPTTTNSTVGTETTIDGTETTVDGTTTQGGTETTVDGTTTQSGTESTVDPTTESTEGETTIDDTTGATESMTDTESTTNWWTDTDIPLPYSCPPLPRDSVLV